MDIFSNQSKINNAIIHALTIRARNDCQFFDIKHEIYKIQQSVFDESSVTNEVRNENKLSYIFRKALNDPLFACYLVSF